MDVELMIASTESVPVWITVLFGLILVGMIACLALEEKLHAKKSLIVACFAVVCLFLGTLTGILSFNKAVFESLPVVPPDEPLELSVVVEEETGETETRVIGGEEAGSSDSLQTSQTEGGESETTEEPAEGIEGKLHFGGHEISMPVYIPGIDWSVIAIILGSSLFVDATSRSGLFSWIAIRVTKLSRGDPLKLLVFYGVMTVVFSAVLNNVTAMIIVGSLTAVSLKKLDRNENLLGFLLIEGLLTNIGGLLTLISSVPNIIVGTTAGISFATFLLKSAPYVVVATIATIWLGAWRFNIRSLQTESEKLRAAKLVEGFDENDGIDSWGFFRFAVGALIVFIVLIAGASSLPVVNKLGMGFVAMSMAAIVLLAFRSEVDRFYKAVDWDLLGFFMGLFVVIYVMEHAAVLDTIGVGLQSVLSAVSDEHGKPLDSSILLVGSAGFSSVTDNIPLAAMLASILSKLGTPDQSTLWWSVIFGANLGGNLTPIGSASTLVAVTIMHKHSVNNVLCRLYQSSRPVCGCAYWHCPGLRSFSAAVDPQPVIRRNLRRTFF